MKKLITQTGIFLLILSGAVYGQSTTISTNPKAGAAVDTTKKGKGQATAKTSATAKPQQKPAAAASTAATAAPKPATKLTGTGGAKPVVKNNQSQDPADLEVKKGSGSSERNTKNLTGKTGNYKNEASKKDQPKQ